MGRDISSRVAPPPHTLLPGTPFPWPHRRPPHTLLPRGLSTGSCHS